MAHPVPPIPQQHLQPTDALHGIMADRDVSPPSLRRRVDSSHLSLGRGVASEQLDSRSHDLMRDGQVSHPLEDRHDFLPHVVGDPVTIDPPDAQWDGTMPKGRSPLKWPSKGQSFWLRAERMAPARCSRMRGWTRSAMAALIHTVVECRAPVRTPA